MFRTLGLWQRFPTLPALAQDHTVPVARTTAGRALQTEREMERKREERRGKKEKKQRQAGGQRDGGHVRVQQEFICGHNHAK